jgi:hypothetical protein
VSKNGYLLLNVGPKPDGTIPEEARDLLLEVGEWLEVNGDAIYGTTPWMIASEGPTNLGEVGDIGFNESNVVYTSKDVRFTVKGDNLYATFLAWPGEEAVITTLRGSGGEKVWAGDSNVDDDLKLGGKKIEAGDFILEFKKGGDVHVTAEWEEDEIEEFDGKYEQENTSVTMFFDGEMHRASYDGEDFELKEGGGNPRYEGFYTEEIKRITMLGDGKELKWKRTGEGLRITMLGDGKELKWKRTGEGLIIETPDEKPCEHAYVIKIERYHHPKID